MPNRLRDELLGDAAVADSEYLQLLEDPETELDRKLGELGQNGAMGFREHGYCGLLKRSCILGGFRKMANIAVCKKADASGRFFFQINSTGRTPSEMKELENILA